MIGGALLAVAAVLLAAGVLPLDSAAEVADRTWSILLFVIAATLVAELAAAAGVFDAVADRLGRAAAGRVVVLWLLVVGFVGLALWQLTEAVGGWHGTGKDAIFSRIKAEWALTRQHLLAILEQDDFLADNPMLKRSLQLRAPYMDPLNHLQVELLKRHRAGDTDERLARGIHLSINGVASGLRNSG